MFSCDGVEKEAPTLVNAHQALQDLEKVMAPL
jgi:hypothetical protein